jgi:hypothetical protein
MWAGVPLCEWITRITPMNLPLPQGVSNAHYTDAMSRWCTTCFDNPAMKADTRCRDCAPAKGVQPKQCTSDALAVMRASWECSPEREHNAARADAGRRNGAMRAAARTPDEPAVAVASFDFYDNDLV